MLSDTVKKWGKELEKVVENNSVKGYYWEVPIIGHEMSDEAFHKKFNKYPTSFISEQEEEVNEQEHD